MKDLPEKSKDALFSQELAEVVIAILQEYELGDFWGVVLDYLRLIAVDLKSEADLRGVLITEVKLRADKAKALAHEIVTLYFE